MLRMADDSISNRNLSFVVTPDELDENKNSSLILSSTVTKVNNSLNSITSESEENISSFKIQNVSEDTFSSPTLSTQFSNPNQNELLEVSLEDQINNDPCGTEETSFNTLANTTTDLCNIFERLHIISDGDASALIGNRSGVGLEEIINTSIIVSDDPKINEKFNSPMDSNVMFNIPVTESLISTDDKALAATDRYVADDGVSSSTVSDLQKDVPSANKPFDKEMHSTTNRLDSGNKVPSSATVVAMKGPLTSPVVESKTLSAMNVSKKEVLRSITGLGNQVPLTEIDVENKVPLTEINIENKVPLTEIDIENKVPLTEIDVENKVALTEIDVENKVPLDEIAVDNKVPLDEINVENKMPLGEIDCENTVPLTEIDNENSVPMVTNLHDVDINVSQTINLPHVDHPDITTTNNLEGDFQKGLFINKMPFVPNVPETEEASKIDFKQLDSLSLLIKSDKIKEENLNDSIAKIATSPVRQLVPETYLKEKELNLNSEAEDKIIFDNFKKPNPVSPVNKSVENINMDSSANKMVKVKEEICYTPVIQMHSPSIADEKCLLPEADKLNLCNPVTPPNENSSKINLSNTDSNSLVSNNSSVAGVSTDDIFKSSLPILELNNNSDKDSIFMVSTDDKFEGEEFQDAVEFFKNPSLQTYDQIKTSNQAGAYTPRDSLYQTFDPFYKKTAVAANKSPAVPEEIAHKPCLKDDACLDNTNDKKVLSRLSVGYNLLSFDSPMKNCSPKNSESNKDLLHESNEKLYSEQEFQQALKLQELALEEIQLKNTKKMEDEFKKSLEAELQKNVEIVNTMEKVTQLNKILREAMIDLATIASDEKTKIQDLISDKKTLEEELKTSAQDLQNMETTFSDFHKRYVNCKDMLKTYKDNEELLKSQVENLNNELDEQKQNIFSLQKEISEMVCKTNAEVADAKKGGDAQVTVLRAQLKKSELKVSSLESDLKQVRNENDNLNNLCDELMAKVSRS